MIDRLQQREDSSAGKDGHFNNGGSDTLPESLINGDSQKQTNEQNGIGREGIPHGGNRQVLKVKRSPLLIPYIIASTLYLLAERL